MDIQTKGGETTERQAGSQEGRQTDKDTGAGGQTNMLAGRHVDKPERLQSGKQSRNTFIGMDLPPAVQMLREKLLSVSRPAT